MVIAVKKNHPLTKLRGKELVRSMAQYPQASPKAFVGIEICEEHPALVKLGVPLKPSFIYDSYDVACSAISTGLYWSLIPELLYNASTFFKMKIPGFKPVTQVCAITPKGRPLPKVIHQFLIEMNSSK